MTAINAPATITQRALTEPILTPTNFRACLIVALLLLFIFVLTWLLFPEQALRRRLPATVAPTAPRSLDR
jgi:hypothetical protein